MPAWKPRGAWAVSACGYDVHVGRLIHMNGRVYDPQLSRFLSPDPLVQAPTNSQSWNRYSYVFNNPLKYVDPSGYETEETVTTCDATCQEKSDRENFARDFMQMVSYSTTSGESWAEVGGAAYNIADIQGMTLFALAQGTKAGGGSKTNSNNILSTLLMASMGGGGGAGDDGSDAAPQPTSPYIPEEHRPQVDKFRELAVEARDQVDQNCTGFCRLPWIRGTKIHKAFADKVKAFNLMNPYFLSEVSYLGGARTTYGAKGSIRADGIYGLADAPNFAVELKTGFAQMTTREYNSYKQNLPAGVPVYGISVF